MPMRNLISILGAVAVGVWAYFGVIERINSIENEVQDFKTPSKKKNRKRKKKQTN